MIHSFSAIFSKQATATQKTPKSVTKIKNYTMFNTYAIVHFRKIDIQLTAKSDASCLSEAKLCSQASIVFTMEILKETNA